MTSYYDNKTEQIKDIFGATDVDVQSDRIIVDDKEYIVVDDVIILLAPDQYPPSLKNKLQSNASISDGTEEFASDIQTTFGDEWQTFPEIMPEHETEFRQYFDIVDIRSLSGKRVCDMGCGIGRWSSFLQKEAKEIVLIDFSEAIFVARKNLVGADNALFFLGDILQLPFRKNFADFLYCLGVAHHLPVDAMEAVKRLSSFAPRRLIYLYSALDGHPVHYRLMMMPVTVLRQMVCTIQNPLFRSIFVTLSTIFLYLPLICVGYILHPLGLSRYVPLFSFYHGKSFRRLRQDAYDRFFTRIEQRVTRKEIKTLEVDGQKVTISPQIPMWHFLVENDGVVK
jgi:SAM-dependent methyltransferase